MKRIGVSCKSKTTIGSRLSPSTSTSTGPSRHRECLANAKALCHAEIAGKLSASIVEPCLIITKKEMNIQQQQDLLDCQVPDFDIVDNKLENDPFMHPPIRAEGADYSHIGSDDELLAEIAEKMGPGATCTAYFQLIPPYLSTLDLTEIAKTPDLDLTG
jgi:hypothetical protein